MNEAKLSLKTQAGSVLLEALIAILIFSIGILAIVGLQAAAVHASAEAKYRVDASFLAGQLVEQMRVSDRTPDKLKTNFASPNGELYRAWRGANSRPEAGTVLATLPGAAAHPPVVTIAPSSQVQMAGNTVTITIYWKAPHEPVTNKPHRYISVTQII